MKMLSLRNNVMKSCVFVLRTMDDNALIDKHNKFNAGEIPYTTNTMVPCGLMLVVQQTEYSEFVYDSFQHIFFRLLLI